MAFVFHRGIYGNVSVCYGHSKTFYREKRKRPLSSLRFRYTLTPKVGNEQLPFGLFSVGVGQSSAFSDSISFGVVGRTRTPGMKNHRDKNMRNDMDTGNNLVVSVQLNVDVRICETVSMETCGASLHLLTWGHAI